jgi:hypothetical protein
VKAQVAFEEYVPDLILSATSSNEVITGAFGLSIYGLSSYESDSDADDEAEVRESSASSLNSCIHTGQSEIY